METSKQTSKNSSTLGVIESIRSTLRNNIRQYGMLIALAVIMLYFQISTEGVLLKPMNVTSLVTQNSYVMVLAIGMTLCILTGGNIDLSVGSLVAFIGAISGVLIINNHMNPALAIVICLLVGAVVGIWQGFWIAFVRIPAFIVTLAGMLIFRGLTLSILKGQTLAPFPDSYGKINNGFIPDFFKGIGANLNITTLAAGAVVSVIYVILQYRKRLERAKYSLENIAFPLFVAQLVVVLAVINIFAYWLSEDQGIPIILVIIGVLILGYSFFTTKTVQGRYLYAMGGNEKAAKLSGINTNKVLFFAYVNMAVLSAVTGIVSSSTINSASPLAGGNFELDAIAACFIGGASAYGGVGTVVGAIIGALVMGILNNGMSMMGVPTDRTQIVKGLVLLLAVAFDVFTKKKSRA
ncbi:MAG: sugar ABC transporter permease [Bacillota bacterium]|nr:sugar ABC transporter permease [Bacillota bacterium]